MRTISSKKSERVKELVRLYKKSDRHAAGLFLAEGPAVVHMALENSQQQVQEIFAREDLISQFEDLDVPVTLCTEEAMQALSSTASPQGVIALCGMATIDAQSILAQPRPVIIVDSISDPGNMGTIIRTADAAGAAGVLLFGNCVDVYNEKVVRSSAGSIFRVPIAGIGSIEEIPETRSILALAGDADMNILEAVEVLGGESALTWVVGSEAHGVGPLWGSALSPISGERRVTHVSIPMSEGVESLNAAVAASICLYAGFLRS
jgi:RNA methyltransferase, TrmH family